MKAKPTRRPRGQFVQGTTYLSRDLKARLDEFVARTKLPRAVVFRAGIEAVLKNPELVQEAP